MPVENGVGYGNLTSLKIEHLSRIMSMHLAVTAAVLRKYPRFGRQYRYLDLTAGKGQTPDGLIGSPLVFLQQTNMVEFPKPIQMDLIECNEQNLHELKMAVDNLKIVDNNVRTVNFHHGNYEDIVHTLISGQDKAEFGLIFADPSGDMPNFDTLRQLAKSRPHMEILIYVSTTNIKRVFHLTEKLLSDYMKDVGKKYWLVRKPVSWDNHKWTFLLGSNTDIFKNYRRIGFLRIESNEAQDFFPILNFSTQQRIQKWQPSLFDES
jgi:hypothetical protein